MIKERPRDGIGGVFHLKKGEQRKQRWNRGVFHLKKAKQVKQRWNRGVFHLKKTK
jgi:hypothetical protein